MICDTMEHGSIYAGLGKNFALFFDYARKTDFQQLPDGLHEIAGRDVYMTLKSYEPRPAETAWWETHKRYADIQYLLVGSERMGIASAVGLVEKDPYDAERDATFYHEPQANYFVPLTAGTFVILFPQDAHLPSLRDGGAKISNRKAVVKIRLD